ncbi:unnamed protein product [Symbiodinium sp. CCMP2592]|nr:unnamed protein product [Symbiodinium sp. CCMP2592]
MIHINCTRSLWDKYPYQLQLSLAQRFATDELKLAAQTFKVKGDWTDPADKFLSFYLWDDADDGELPAFQADSASFSQTLKFLLRDADDLQEAFMIDDFDEDLDMDMSLPEKSEKQMDEAADEEKKTGEEKNRGEAKNTGEAKNRGEETRAVILKSAAEALADAMKEVFLDDAFVEQIQGLPSTNEFVLYVARGFLKCATDQADILKTLSATPLFQAITDAWAQVTRMMRALLLGLGKAEDASASAADAFWYAQYSGSSFFDRSVKGVLQKSSWWQAQLADIARVAGARPLLQPKILRLEELVGVESGESLSGSQLKELVHLLEEVRPALRQGEVEELFKKAENVARSAATALQATTDLTNLSAAKVESVAKLFQMLAHVPGVPSAAEEFQKWSTKSSQHLTVNSLLECMKAATRSEIDFVNLRESLEACSTLQPSKATMIPYIVFIRIALLHFADKVLASEKALAEVKPMVTTCLSMAKKLVPPDFKELSQLVNAHIQGVQYAGVYHWRLRKFSDMGADAAARLAKDPKIQFLTVLQASKAKCAGHATNLAEAQQTFETKIAEQDSDISADPATAELLSSKKAMDVILDASQEPVIEFMDCIKYQNNVMKERVKELSAKACDTGCGYQAGGANFWRAGVGLDANVAELQALTLGDDFKAKIKLTAIRTATDSVLQVRKEIDDFLGKFDLPSDDIAATQQVLEESSGLGRWQSGCFTSSCSSLRLSRNLRPILAPRMPRLISRA